MAFTGRPDTFLESNLSNNGFFPELSLGTFQKVYRVPADRAQESVELELKLARNTINDSLEDKQAEWQGEGHTTLVEVDAANNTDLVTYYESAVFNLAKANLLSDFQTFTRRESAEDLAKEGDPVSQSLHAESNRCLRRLLGIKTNITVDLI